jgi:hypothetical protein
MEEKRGLKTAKREDLTKEGSQSSPHRLIALMILINIFSYDFGMVTRKKN